MDMNKDNNSELIYIEYDRKSSESKEKQALSLRQQRDECKKVEHEHELNVKYRFSESKSAFKPHNRDNFDISLGLIRQEKANAFLTWKPDRLCRNPEEGGILLQMLQDKVLKEIRTATGDIYTPDSDHLILQIHFGMANQYSRNLSQNVKRGLNSKCERGEYPRPACIGYEGYGERGQRLMRPHPFEAPLILKTCELAATGGYSLSKLSDKMYELGLRTKKGKKVSKSHIYNILICPTYYGYFYQNGELFEGNYEPIITKVLYDRVQEVLQNHSKPKVKVWERTYNGLMTCGDCGCQITTIVKVKFYKRTNRTVVYTYHQCTHRRGHCKQEAITGKRLEELLTISLKRITIDEEAWKLGIDLFKAKHEEEMSMLSKRARYLQNQYNAKRDALKAIVRMRADNELTKEEFLEQKEEILKDKSDIKGKLEENDTSVDTWLELCTKFLNNAFSAQETMLKGTLQEKRDLILDVGQNLILKDGELQFSFKQPYDVLLKPEYRTNVLRDQDSNLNKQLQRLLSYR
jgi:site-specific DNA recombinase